MTRRPRPRMSHHSRRALSFASALALFASGAARPAAAAGPPDPARCMLPSHVNLVGTALGVADPAGLFTVIVRDADDQGCPGVVVTFDISGAPDIGFASSQPVVTYLSCTQVSATTDAEGRANFIVVGGVTDHSGNWSPTGSGTFTVGTATIGTVSVGAFDLDGVDGATGNDIHFFLGPYFAGPPYPAVLDYDGDGSLGASDLSLLMKQIFVGNSTDPYAMCGSGVTTGAVTATGNLELKVSPDCLTGDPTTFCSGSHTDLVFKVTSPVALGEVTSVMADLTILGPPGVPLPDFWRFDSPACHMNGLQVVPVEDGENCYGGSAIFTDPGDLSTVETSGGMYVPSPGTSDPVDEARVRAGLFVMPRYVGPGIPNPPLYLPCNDYGYGHLPFLGSNVAFALRIRNTTPCGGCATTPPVKIRLDGITFTRIQPGDLGYSMGPKFCPNAAPAAPGGVVPAGAAGRFASRGTEEPSALVILPDSSGSNIISTDGSTTGVPTPASASAPLWLAPAAPNPASGGTLLRFGLPATERVRIAIMDVAGRIVRVLADGLFASGEHRLVWDGTDGAGARVRAGVYFCRLATGKDLRSTAIVLAP